ncbi:hypothetical protein WICPIJ_003287 [Wickerhamomyces pijperi]|uniref:U4/U6.U5 small nuclear ribonucleoprotein 27kDa protein domain-containing protein n=1 Tax=Wickerhamomyces pijperi TaxID=599730 RepID=A0A9P8Q7X7_WICPI|nr:hypothetical protein WICPIJ_003287 [Wickerhamomyces pijperi]
MANRYDQKPSQRRSDLSPTRNHHSVSGTGTNTANNFRDRSNDRYEPNNRKPPQKSNNRSQRDMNDLTLEEEQTIEKEQNERGRKLTKDSNEIEIEDSNDDSEMMKLMGFGSFQTTKNQKVQGQVNGAVKKNKKTEFRQYMNREKGFNRALSPDRDGKQHKKRR